MKSPDQSTSSSGRKDDQSTTSSGKKVKIGVSPGDTLIVTPIIEYEKFHKDYPDKSKFFMGLWGSKYLDKLNPLLPIVKDYIDYSYPTYPEKMRGFIHIANVFDNYDVYKLDELKELLKDKSNVYK